MDIGLALFLIVLAISMSGTRRDYSRPRAPRQHGHRRDGRRWWCGVSTTGLLAEAALDAPDPPVSPGSCRRHGYHIQTDGLPGSSGCATLLLSSFASVARAART